MINKHDFNFIVDQICTNNNLSNLRVVVEKELLHYDILFALSENKILEKLVFQGGTALRLCYGLKRFSEDLDFVGGKDFSSHDVNTLKSVLEDYITRRYGFEIKVKEPKEVEDFEDNVHVSKWVLNVNTHPEKKDMASQKIRIEIANVPAHTKLLKPILSNYELLPNGYEDIFLYVESIEEIYADKIIALAARKYIKARDLWDLQWLSKKNLSINMDYIHKKINDYEITNFYELLSKRNSELFSFINGPELHKELSRFLDSNTVERTLNKPGFLDYLFETIKEIISEVQKNK